MNASGTAKLALNYGQATTTGAGSDYVVGGGAQVNLPAGQNFSTKQGSTGTVKNYTVVTSLGATGSTTGTDLQGINGNLAGNYVLGKDIDAASTSTWDSGAGFQPIGYRVNATTYLFSGIFDGLGHVVNGISIQRPSSTHVGLFGAINNGSAIRNLGMNGGNVSGQNSVGALVGLMELESVVSNSYATSSVSGLRQVGGLVGFNAGRIENSFTYSDVRGQQYVGGLVGESITSASIRNSYASGNVSGRSGSIGGLVGHGGGIVMSYASGQVSCTECGVQSFVDVGGLAGYTSNGVVNSYWNTQIPGQNFSYYGTGKTSAQMQQQSTYTGWDFVNTWIMLPGNNYPTLRNNPVRVAVVTPDPAIEAARLAAINAAAAAADRLAATEAARVAELARQAAIVAEQARLAGVIRLARVAAAAAAEADRLAALATARVAELASQAEVARLAALAAEQVRLGLAEVIRLARVATAAEAARVAAAQAAQISTAIGSLTNIVGSVMVARANVNGDVNFVHVQEGTPILRGDIVMTDPTGTTTIAFNDGSLLRIDTSTTVELLPLQPIIGSQFQQTIAESILTDGRLWGRILTGTGVNLGGGGIVAGVRG